VRSLSDAVANIADSIVRKPVAGGQRSYEHYEAAQKSRP